LAKSAYIPMLKVKSSIKREESLEDSKSYFFVEIEELKGFLNHSNDNNKYLFINLRKPLPLVVDRSKVRPKY